MEIHALQTGTVRVKQFQLTGASNTLSRFYQLVFTQKWSEWLPIYAWLIVADDELILVDVGESAKIFEEGFLPSGGLYHKAVETRITEEEEITHQIKALGYDVKGVKTVLLTHMHGDHMNGIYHFEHAKIHVPKAEYDFAISKKGPGSGYFQKNWPSWFQPELISYGASAEGSFSQSKAFNDHITMVPTPGHSMGHQSVIVKDGSTNYFIGGDLTYNIDTLKSEVPNVVLPSKDAFDSVKKAHEYVRTKDSIYLSAHDWNVPKILKEKLAFSQC
ncbi:MAG: MBL fold metallo-hydrolase [Bacteroidota bacterium]